MTWSRRKSKERLRGRGLDGGKVFVDVESIRQRIENEKRIKEEERVQAQLNLEIEAIKKLASKSNLKIY